MKSKVYFVKTGSSAVEERALALKRLLEEIGPLLKYKKDEIVPVKITVGDSACVYNLSPDLAKVIIRAIKKQGAKPFLFDTSVIYNGERQNAVDHLNLAQSKGFGQTKVGAPFIVADGVFGQDGREFEIDSEYINKIKTPSFVTMLDSLLVLSHPTGHIVSGYAGAIKNVAMGMSCRATKQMQHSSLKPSIIEKKCAACGCCIGHCPVAAISFKHGLAFIDQKKCIGCAECLCACKFGAVVINWHEDCRVFSARMADTSGFILSKFKNKFFFNFAFDITKECDCISNREERMVSQNLGILASDDILSLDKATSDLAQENKIGSFFTDKKNIYETMYERAAQKGLGSLDYQLIEV